MKMQPTDYYIYAEGYSKIHAVGNINTWNLDWPEEITHKGFVYKFNGQNPMPSWAAGNYHGCAEYTLEK